MNKIDSSQRRLLLKSLLTAPFIGAGLKSLASETNSVNRTIGHHFKISLNVYSFNAMLREGKIDLFDVLDFCYFFTNLKFN